MPTASFQDYSLAKLEPAFEIPQAGYHPVAFKPSQTILRGTVLGQVTATGLYAIYNVANTDGTEVARCVAMYDGVVDAAGLVVLGIGISATEYGGTGRPTMSVYLNGCFFTNHLNVNGTAGITTAVLTGLSGRLLSGLAATSGTTGILVF